MVTETAHYREVASFPTCVLLIRLFLAFHYHKVRS